jgi:uncharacterized protein
VLELTHIGGANKRWATCALLVIAGSSGATEVEKLIGGDAALAARDAELAALYRRVRAHAFDPSMVEAQQKAWLRDRRDACRDVTCLLREHDARMAELKQLRGAPGPDVAGGPVPFKEFCAVEDPEATVELRISRLDAGRDRVEVGQQRGEVHWQGDLNADGVVDYLVDFGEEAGSGRCRDVGVFAGCGGSRYRHLLTESTCAHSLGIATGASMAEQFGVVEQRHAYGSERWRALERAQGKPASPTRNRYLYVGGRYTRHDRGR